MSAESPAARPLELTVNGESRTVGCAPDTPLLYALRNDLGLLGTKFGCGLDICGACTVLVGGRPTRSCVTPVSSVTGEPIVTVEGLGTEQSPHPLQRAFLGEQALQCGYCIPGILVTAAALLERTPDADEAAVRAALDGNLCRCGSHNRIVRAVLAAAQELR